MSTMTSDDLLECVKTLLRFSIATKLEIKVIDYLGSLDTQTRVNSLLSNVMAIGYNESLDAAVGDLIQMYGVFLFHDVSGDLEEIKAEVEECNRSFGTEIAAFKEMHRLNRLNVVPRDILGQLWARVEIDDSYTEHLDFGFSFP